jgi:DNA helicase-2/ATP-dependent DNA helicase PcrA
MKFFMEATVPILDTLTEAQREAVTHVDGPLLILAGPGSGKTRVVTHRIAHLLSQGIPARHILALTFTNKSAEEMRSRLHLLIPDQPVWMGTFHRFCSRLLRIHAPLTGLSENFSIFDVGDARNLLMEAIDEANVLLTHTTPDRIAHEISSAKNELIGPEEYVGKHGKELGGIAEKVYPLYQKRLLRANAVDFDDLLLHVATLLRENPELRRILDERYRYILVDEYQDTNFAQYTIVRALSQDYPNLAVTGDPDQSIYGWRGANLNNILEFEQDYPHVRVVRLEQNYRSTKRILRVADQLICNNLRRKHKDLFTDNPEGQPVRLVVYPQSRDEAEHISEWIADRIRRGQRKARDFAIFYRANWLSRSLEQSLRSAGVPYQIVKGLEFYQRKEIKDVIGYLQLLNNPRNDAAFRRVINSPPRQIGKVTVERLAEQANRKNVSLLEAAREAGLNEVIPKRAASYIAAFVALYDRLSLTAGQPLLNILEAVLRESKYIEWLEGSEDEEDRERVGNIRELVSAVSDFDLQHPGDNHLEEFLEQVALVADTDDWESNTDKVSLMTLHAAKGLEFPVVFIVGVEQGLLPHERSLETSEGVEEERRLLFVGITRAEEELQLSYSAYRQIQGSQKMRIASEFLMELPREEMEVHKPSTVVQRAAEYAAHQGEYDPDAEWQDHPEIVHELRQPATVASSPIISAPLMTASELLNGTSESKSDSSQTDRFREGTIVQHPTHGLGKITAISGIGGKRLATIQFFKSSRPAKIFLAHSQLQPVQSDS